MVIRTEQQRMWQTNAGLLTWAENAVAKTAEQPGKWGLSPEVKAQLDAQTATFGMLERRALDPNTKTPAVMQVKVTARQELLKTCRVVTKMVQANPAVPEDQWVQLLISRRDTKPTPIPAPAVPPVLTVSGADGALLLIRVGGEGRRVIGRPKGAIGVQIYTHVGSEKPGPLSQWRYQGASTKREVLLDFTGQASEGATVWVTAAWYTRTNLVGPSAIAVTGVLQYGRIVLPIKAVKGGRNTGVSSSEEVTTLRVA